MSFLKINNPAKRDFCKRARKRKRNIQERYKAERVGNIGI